MTTADRGWVYRRFVARKKPNALRLAILIPILFIFVDAWSSFSVPNPSYFAEWDIKDTFSMAEDAVGNHIGDYTLTDEDGNRFTLKGLLDKPLIISFVYTTCPDACPVMTLHLRDAIREAGMDFGKRFRALTISFDPHDTPERMKGFAGNFKGDLKDWKFAVGDREAIIGLARDVGLSYTKEGNRFRHLNFFTIVDKDGKVYKQVYGIDFKPKTVLRYVDMSLNQRDILVHLVNVFDTLKAFCYTYDAKTGRYILNYAILIPVVMGVFVQTAIVILLVYIFRARDLNAR